MSTKRLFICIILAEYLTCIFLGSWMIRKIYQKINVLGAQQLTRLRKEDFIATYSSMLKYFYEQVPAVPRSDDWPYLPEPVVNITNTDGMNSNHEYTIPKTQNLFRIVALGDSFTFGQHVNTNESWPNLLESILDMRRTCPQKTTFEVLNMGIPG